MTFQDLADSLPNGFHDAHLKSVCIDYVERLLAMQMEILVGTPEAQDRDEYRKATLTVTGLYFCVIDPPDAKYPFTTKNSHIWVSGDNGWPDTLSDLAASLAQTNPRFTYHRFFSVDWNSFIYVAADDVQLSWS
jgi:hypothetical protein